MARLPKVVVDQRRLTRDEDLTLLLTTFLPLKGPSNTKSQYMVALVPVTHSNMSLLYRTNVNRKKRKIGH